MPVSIPTGVQLCRLLYRDVHNSSLQTTILCLNPHFPNLNSHFLYLAHVVRYSFYLITSKEISIFLVCYSFLLCIFCCSPPTRYPTAPHPVDHTPLSGVYRCYFSNEKIIFIKWITIFMIINNHGICLTVPL